VASLKGQTRGRASLDDDHFQEALCFPVLEKTNMGFGIQMSYIVKQISAFIYGHYASALAAAQQASLKSYQGNGMILVDSAHHFYFALTLAALYPQAPARDQRRFASMLADELERHRVWAEHCPQNFRNAHALVGAEIARIEGREDDAERLYEQAIQSANENGIVQNEAIACELASIFYRRRGFERIADTYLRAARTAYVRWGADGKVAQLDARYRQLQTQPAEASGLAEGSMAMPLDVMSVLKASQAISGRLLLEELSNTLLHLVLENAGAQTGSLLLCDGEALELAAQASVDQAAGDESAGDASAGDQVHVRFYSKRAPAKGSLPTAILNYVMHSREQVLLEDVAQPNPFSTDAYFVTHRPKSVLCLPILRQDALIGLLYVENNLVTHAFMPKRVVVLNLLASQIAISLENAQLYANLLQENRERKLVENTLRESEARIRRLVDANIIGVAFMDTSGGISEANEAFWQLSGYARQELGAGAVRWTDMTPPEYHGADEQAIEELKKTGICTPFEKEYIRKDGSRAPVLIGAAMMEGSQDQLVCFVLDLSARKQAEEQVRHMAGHDALTGLPNRVLFQDRMKLAIAYAHRNHSGMAILFIDLDCFKNINDSLGHHIGDVVLQMTALRLQTCLREGDILARLGGDEFVFSLPWLDDSSDAAKAAQKALEALTPPFIVEGHELHVNASIGISLYPEDGTDVETLMRTADTAMYHAKKMGRGNFQFFMPALNEATQQRLFVGARLRQALAHNEFVLHYQPQVNMESGRILSVEALLRWQPPGMQPISCGAFIFHAEESGLIVPIGEWALRQACRQLKIWHDAGHPELKIAVNLSPRQLEQPHFCTLAAQILDEAGICATDLELEITESIMMQHNESTLAKLTELSNMGIQLAVDDFGTGYSSLSYLQRFPVHCLKIDQSFVRGIGTNPNDMALVTAIIAMAASLHLKVIAEGVETLQQKEFLLAHDCLSAQGFYFSKAVPAETLLGLLGSNTMLKNA
jgi:diguanylate cyclase (GGDEF)-like protein/PAS domain S-box-containing protein